MKNLTLSILLISVILISACNQQIPNTNYVATLDNSQDTNQRDTTTGENPLSQSVQSAIEDKETINLTITDIKFGRNSIGYVTIDGRVKNNGDRTARYVQVNIDFFKENEWLNNEKFYTKESDISPGQYSSFSWSVKESDIAGWTTYEAYVTYNKQLS